MIEILSGKQFPKKVIPLIKNAKKSIDIVVFDWRWYPNNIGSSCQLFNQAIIQQAQKGVKIRAITNCYDIIQILNNNKIKAKKITTHRLMHAKLMIIDDHIVITGSHNYTQSAFTFNLELSVILKEFHDTESFINFFENLWQK